MPRLSLRLLFAPLLVVLLAAAAQPYLPEGPAPAASTPTPCVDLGCGDSCSDCSWCCPGDTCRTTYTKAAGTAAQNDGCELSPTNSCWDCPTATPTPTPTATPTSTATPTPTPTATPTSTPACPLYKVRVNMQDHGAEPVYYVPGPDERPCVVQKLAECDAAYNAYGSIGGCWTASLLMRSVSPDVAMWGGDPSAPYVTNDMMYDPGWTAICDPGQLTQDKEGDVYCHSGTIYLKADCTSVTDATVQEMDNACLSDTLTWWKTWDSPISLLLQKGLDVDDDPTFVRFPLNPRRPDSWYAWKASALAPLLVYDPSHSGTITSATQLFGNWTFGGKRVANAELNAAFAQQEWQNGYEALATLDNNGDGKLDGAELEPLGLWFDKNRDSRSQPGEVERLTAAGVTTLYYTPNRKDEASGNVYADRGYERLVDGHKATGASVDWFTEPLDSKYSLITHLPQAASPASLPPAKEKRTSAASRSTGDKPDALAAKILGTWKWKTVESNGPGENAPHGWLSFEKLNNGTLTGRSIHELAFAPAFTLARRKVTVSLLQGSAALAGDGKVKLKFTVDSRHKPSVSTEAVLSEDGKTLNGHTTASVDYHGKPIKISYRWVAERGL